MYQGNNHNNGDPLFFQSVAAATTTHWTRLEDKVFEQCLVLFPEGTPDRWEKIAAHIPGKSAQEVELHFHMLVYDVYEIDAGRIEVPKYADDSVMLSEGCDSHNQISFVSKSKPQGESERKKGTPWTEEEHKYAAFLFFIFYFEPSPLHN